MFPIPDALLTASPEIPGLDGRKMSKSYGNAIALSMTEDETAAAIKRTRTDSDRVTTFDPQGRPGVSALLTTTGLCLDLRPEEVAEIVGDSGGSELERLTTDTVNGFLSPFRRRRANFAQDSGLASRVLQSGNDRPNAIATKTLNEVRQAMGTTY